MEFTQYTVILARLWDMSYVNSLTTIWLLRRREEYNFILLLSPVYCVQGREVWHECELASLYYTPMFKVEWNSFPDRRNLDINDYGKIVDIVSVASDSEV